MAYRRTDKVEKRLKERRRRMLHAARTHFSAQGYAATTMQQVAKSAGTSIGNLYFYFSNKEELLLAVVDDFMREIGGRIDRAKALFDAGAHQIAGGVYAAILAAMSNDQLVALILMSDGAQSLRQRVLEYFTARLLEFFDEHREEIPEGQHLMVAHAWQGALFNVLEQRLSGELSCNDLELARFLALWNLRGLGYEQDSAERIVRQVETRVCEEIEGFRGDSTRNAVAHP
ncbi:MAG: helix-turn-helix domain-containing protein [Myxococcota bacterium]